MRYETHNLHGEPEECEVYDMPPVPMDYWSAVTNVPCPVAGCNQTVIWYEAGYVPGYRVCAAPAHTSILGNAFDHGTIKHRFIAKGSMAAPVLIRDRSAEGS